MANKERGQVEFKSDDKTFLLTFTNNAICDAEGVLDKSIVEIVQMIEKGRITAVRAVFWAGLHENHPEIDLKQAGSMMTGRLPEVTDAISKAFQLSQPEASDESPPKPDQQPGTGPAS